MTTSYIFYPFADIYTKQNSKSKSLYNALRLIVPDMPDFVGQIEALRSVPISRDDLETRLNRFSINGMYCLYQDKSLVSVAVLQDYTIDRIITMPKFRRQGHAVRLINEVRNKMIQKGKAKSVFSPVNPEAFPVFEKAGWVKVGEAAHDGSYDYTPPECVAHYNRIVGMDIRPWMLYLLTLQV